MSPVLAGSTFIRPHLNLGYGDDREDGINTLPDLVEFNAKHNPDHIFGQQFRVNDQPPCVITFSQFATAVERTSAWLVGTGATTGRTEREVIVPPVALLLGSDITLFMFICALLRIGTPVLIISARLTPVAILHLLKKTNPSALLVSGQVTHSVKETIEVYETQKPEDFTLPQIVESIGYEEFLNPTGALAEYPVPPRYPVFSREDLGAFIMHSSGTTGLPKPISHSQTYPLIYSACHRFPEQKEPFRYQASTLPLYHGFGLLATNLSLSIGMPFVLPPATVIPTGKTTLAMLKASGARYLLSVPSILEDILRLPGKAGLEALQELEVVAIGGAAMKENVGSELVANGVNLLNHWGATEIGAIAPIEHIPRGYDWHYLMPRTDIGLRFVPMADGSNTYRLIGRAPGWTEDFVVQDLLEAHPQNVKHVKILGRADDLIVLATGEKVRPTTMEQAVSEHPDVKDVLAFGEGQASLGLVIELKSSSTWDVNDPDAVEALRESLVPYLTKGNSYMDHHAKISREMLIFTRQDSDRRLLRTDKGSFIRKANWAQFDKDIKDAYERADMLSATPLPLPTVDNGEALLAAIRGHIKKVNQAAADSEDTADFFEIGMDSLQATRLRRAILNGLKVTKGLSTSVTELDPDFVFENSSTIKLFNAVKSVMEGDYNVDGETKEARRITVMEEMVEKYREELASFADIAAEAREKRKALPADYDDQKVVLLTGSTGSLGGFLLARIASDPTVKKLYCLNRATPGVDVRERQISLMKKRGAELDEQYWDKVEILEYEATKVDFGLGDAKYNELIGVTHVMHNAWPVNFNRNLASFEPHVQTLSNLFRLAIQSAGTRPASAEPTRVLFASSIAVVGRFPLLNPEGPLEVPEVPLDAINTAEFGYPEAKWVCERVGMAAGEQYGQDDALVKASSVRIGQMTGPEGSGTWNESEHFPLLVHSSAALKVVPALSGSLSWIPVNRAGDAITDMLFSKGFRPIYHMENPSRQSWEGLVESLASILGDAQPLPSVPFGEWLEKVKAAGEEKNPAYRVLNFLQNDFVRMSSGVVILRTAETKLDSPTLVKSTAIDRKHLEEYIAYWRRVDAMQ
ncbi:Linear gramicidin synthase subunit D [Leucoagaricus sp. SymC.cos]|nr:Linear gramicidin synthase subunit D [Leucoagaricus sp. SymC.cos]